MGTRGVGCRAVAARRWPRRIELVADVKLYHYTCLHAATLIRASRWLQPNPQVQLPDSPALVWLTDLDRPDIPALGLTSLTLQCDRTEYQVTTVTMDAVHWPVYAKHLPGKVRAIIEASPGALPMHWWVAEIPVPILDVRETG